MGYNKYICPHCHKDDALGPDEYTAVFCFRCNKGATGKTQEEVKSWLEYVVTEEDTITENFDIIEDHVQKLKDMAQGIDALYDSTMAKDLMKFARAIEKAANTIDNLVD